MFYTVFVTSLRHPKWYHTPTHSAGPQWQHKSQTPVFELEVWSSELSSSSCRAYTECYGIHLSKSSLCEAPAARAPDESGEDREGPRHKRERGDQAAAPAEDSPVCDSQTLSLINQA